MTDPKLDRLLYHVTLFYKNMKLKRFGTAKMHTEAYEAIVSEMGSYETAVKAVEIVNQPQLF